MKGGRRIPSLRLAGLVAALVLAGCGPCPVEERPAAPAPSPGEPEAGAPPIRLQPAPGSGILILEDDTDAAWRQEQAPGEEGLSGRPAPALPPGHQAFRDHHVTVYVPDLEEGIEKALQAAAAAGGQVISYPISGFEDLGPHERTLVFDARTYPAFLRRVRDQGKAEYPEIGPSDFVTVRLTVIEN